MLTLPTVHMNGTSRQDLVAGYVQAINKVEEAITALRQAAPNGRDYYPVPGSLEKAQAEHDVRIGRFTLTLAELNSIAEGIV
jgi:hypothetical protein